ncbi:hypothetical protein L596_002631 [Steinernema carpocapsae]|uniref:Uncharacterized protein n=1 Tax=Steinernema carpocapsae TaxID=34508 RepID=A0A4U8USP7_STECR|nr:hypothetical protein L596_002631 [Steinernema carpocapsae]
MTRQVNVDCKTSTFDVQDTSETLTSFMNCQLISRIIFLHKSAANVEMNSASGAPNFLLARKNTHSLCFSDTLNEHKILKHSGSSESTFSLSGALEASDSPPAEELSESPLADEESFEESETSPFG